MPVCELSRPAIALRLALLLTLLPGMSGRAQAERLPIKAYTTADGLGSSAIGYVMADSHGFLWFCTRDGLSRFDGQQFVTYGAAEGLSVPTTQTIEGFGNESVRVFDITDSTAAVEVAGKVFAQGNGYAVTVDVGGPALERCWL